MRGGDTPGGGSELPIEAKSALIAAYRGGHYLITPITGPCTVTAIPTVTITRNVFWQCTATQPSTQCAGDDACAGPVTQRGQSWWYECM